MGIFIMKKESKKEIDSRRTRIINMSRLNCVLSALVLLLNIVFIVGAIWYITNVRLNATKELRSLQEEVVSLWNVAQIQAARRPDGLA